MLEKNLAMEMTNEWNISPRWAGIRRSYSAEDVLRLRGSFQIEHTVAIMGAESAQLITSDVDPYDVPHIASAERIYEGFFYVKGGLENAISRGLAYAPYADIVWCETGRPDVGEAREFAQAIHEKFPGKMLAYNCSPSFNWYANLEEKTIVTFQQQLGEMGYKYQFVTLAGFHSLNVSMFDLALGYRKEGMTAYTRLQNHEFDLEHKHGYAAVKHQSFVGAGYFDRVQIAITGGLASTVSHQPFIRQ